MRMNETVLGSCGLENEAMSDNVKPTTEQTEQPKSSDIPKETGKWEIRHKIWDYLEKNNLVNVPRPCHHRIPNFVGAAAANEKLSTMEDFRKARTVKVSPDKPQEHARFLVLESHKNLLVPTPQIRTGLLNRVIPPEGASKERLHRCCTSQGVKENSKEIGLGDKVIIDLLVVGSVAVSRNGFRIGKGKGFADLEYAMLREIRAINGNTVVVTSVHDSQVVEIPEKLIEDHDMSVDYIITPTQLIKTNRSRPQPTGVIWSHLDASKFYQIPVLRQLRDMQRVAGQDVRLKGEATNQNDQPMTNKPGQPRMFTGSNFSNRGHYSRNYGRGRVQRGGRSDIGSRHENVGGGLWLDTGSRHDTVGRRSSFKDEEQRTSVPQSQRQTPTPNSDSVVWLGGLSNRLRVSELKAELRALDLNPVRLVWCGGRGFAFIHFQDVDSAREAVTVLTGRKLDGQEIKAEISKMDHTPRLNLA